MRWFGFLFLLSFAAIPAASGPSAAFLDPELGIVYHTPTGWDGDQWGAVFRDPSPPMGWAVMPVGKETCGSATPFWLSNVKRKQLRPAIMFDPFLTPSDIRQGIDCALALGFERIILDEYVSYQTTNLNRPICTVLSEVRSLYNYAKAKSPSVEFCVDDNWHSWMLQLARGQSDSCGRYPYFKADMAGVSVLSKYGNPAQGKCGHPTASEMREQLLDLEPTVRDYSRSSRIFVWQLNQNWYPGREDVLQLFRQAGPVFGWERFPLWGPTTTVPREDNWAYQTSGGSESCPATEYEWYLPARQYLLRIAEGQTTRLTLQGPSQITSGSTAAFSGQITAGTGIHVNGVELQTAPAPGTTQSFRKEITAPSGAPVALVGLRINTQLPNDVRRQANLAWSLSQLIEKGSTHNLVNNPQFKDGFRSWVVLANTTVVATARGAEVACSPKQLVTITSFPIPVVPGRTYTVNFDARLFQESRLNGYFFISWNSVKEVRRDKFFLNFADPQTVAAAPSGPNGSFQFQWQPQQAGAFDVFAFFNGSRAYQPSITSIRVNVD